MIRSVVGMSSSIGAFAITLTQVEQALRVASAAVGLAIAIVTLVMMLRGKK